MAPEKQDQLRDLKAPQCTMPVRVGDLLSKAGSSDKLIVGGMWGASLLLSIALGIASVHMNWSGIPVHFGGVDFYVTVYPPLVLALFWTLWFGFWWGFAPAYLTTLLLSLHSGMPLGWAFLFSFADPLGLAVFYLGYRALPFEFGLRNMTSFLYFATLSFVAGVFGSSGAFVWMHTHALGFDRAYPIWQGWWVGAHTQTMLLVAPLLFILNPAVSRWMRSRPWVTLSRKGSRPDLVPWMGGAVFMGVVFFLLITVRFITARLDSISAHAESEAVIALFLVCLVTLCAFGFFGYQLFRHANRRIRQASLRLKEANQSLKHRAMTDELTGLANRRHFYLAAAMEMERSQRYQHQISLICLDLDHFKQINDTCSHAAGDAVLRKIGDILRTELREVDFAARIGGEEFVIMLPETSMNEAAGTAERLRNIIAISHVEYDGLSIGMTASFGVVCTRSGISVDKLLSLADKALYQAKDNGRNCVVVSP